MTSVTIRLTEEEGRAARAFAAQERRTLADAMRTVFLERLEDEYDLKELRAARAEHNENPVTHSLKDVMKEFEIHE